MKVLLGLFPAKKIGSKRSLPWITQAIERLIRKRDSLYQRYKRSPRPKHRKQFIETRHMVNAKIKQAYDCYLEDLLGINNPDLNISPADETGQSKSLHQKSYFLYRKTHARTRKVLVLSVTPIPTKFIHPTLTE